MTKIIGLRELRENTNRYIDAVTKGDEFLVMRRSRPVFKLVLPSFEDKWEEVVDFTSIKKGGVVLDDLLTRL